MKKWIKISLLSVLGLIIVAGVLTWIEFGHDYACHTR